MKHGPYLRLKKRKKLTPEPPFSVAVFRDLIAPFADNHMPEEAGIESLCGPLNMAHAWYFLTQEDRDYAREVAEAQKARGALVRKLERLKERGPWLQRRLGPLLFNTLEHIDQSLGRRARDAHSAGSAGAARRNRLALDGRHTA